MKCTTKVDLEMIRYMRKQNGYTQEDIGKRLGVTGSNYYHREAGHMYFRADEMALLAELYQQPLESLFRSPMPTYVNIGLTHQHPDALQAIKKVLEDYSDIIVNQEKALSVIDQSLEGKKRRKHV